MKPVYQLLGVFSLVAWTMAGSVLFRVQYRESQIKSLEFKTAQQYAETAAAENSYRLSKLFAAQREDKDKEIRLQEEQNDKEHKEQEAKKQKEEQQEEEQRIALILKHMEKGRKICTLSHEETWWFSDCGSKDEKPEPCEWKTWVCDRWKTRR